MPIPSDLLEHLQHLPQAGLDVARQIDLGDVAGDHRRGAEADPGQEHLHLFHGGVLRLVEDDEGVIQRPAAHECQRRDFDDAALDQVW